MIEKHEGPERWDSEFKSREPEEIERTKRYWPEYDPETSRAEFLEIGEHWVLLPIGNSHHANLTVLHQFLSAEGYKLVLYLKDTTHDDDIWSSGFVAICDLILPEKFYLATFYHNWFIIDYDAAAVAFFAKPLK